MVETCIHFLKLLFMAADGCFTHAVWLIKNDHRFRIVRGAPVEAAGKAKEFWVHLVQGGTITGKQWISSVISYRTLPYNHYSSWSMVDTTCITAILYHHKHHV